MAANPAPLDRLRIATPCPISWEQMTGDSRVRFCDHCQLNVYNLSALSRLEAEQLIAVTEGRLCARLFRRADGTVLTKDCPLGLRALRRQVAKRTAAIFAAIVSFSAVAFGQHGSKNEKTACTPQTKVTRTTATSGPNEKVLSGTVVDPIGAAIPQAKVKLLNGEAKEVRQTASDDDGKFEFGAVDAGSYSITIESPGFKTLQITNLTVERDKLTNVDAILELSGGFTVGLMVAEPGLIDTPPGTTIFTEKMIQRLPLPK